MGHNIKENVKCRMPSSKSCHSHKADTIIIDNNFVDNIHVADTLHNRCIMLYSLHYKELLLVGNRVRWKD